MELGGYKEDTVFIGINGGKTVTTGFGHNTVLSAADKVIDAVKKGDIRHFLLVGGCDGAKPGRNYYTDFVKKSPQDTIILTLACGKFRFNDLDLGTVAGLPRIMDMGPVSYTHLDVYKRQIIGCYAQGTHAIVNTENCVIQHEANNLVANAVRGVIRRLNITTYDEKTRQGVLRHVIGRVGIASGEIMVVLVTSTEILPKQEKVVEELRRNIPGVVSIIQNINPNHTNVILGNRTLKLWGKTTIVDKMGEFSFNISARSFFQVNTKQAEVLYNKAVEYANLTGKETVIDAYCGTGTISLFLAKKAKKVYGIEIVEPAVKDAIRNAENNKVENAEFIVGDAVEIMPDLYEKMCIRDSLL